MAMTLEEKRKIKREAVEDGMTFYKRMIKCGKPNCSKCPHGPYEYAYKHEDGEMLCVYIGRVT